MAKKAKTNRAKQQRALKKRTVRRQKRKRARQIAADAVAAANPRRIIRGARRMEPAGAWVESGWQDVVVTRLAVTREMQGGNLLFVEYLVDIRCLGLLGSRYYTNVPPEDLESEILPRLYRSEPPLAISHELANEIIWGAVEYAEGFGFPPHAIFRRDTQFALEAADALPRSAGVQFGYDGMPLYAPAPWDASGSRQAAVVKTLIDTAGMGNFIYQPPDEEIPQEVADILADAAGAADEPAASPLADDPELWMPGNVDESSGLWLPGMEGEEGEDYSLRLDADGGEQPPAGALWTPGRE